MTACPRTADPLFTPGSVAHPHPAYATPHEEGAGTPRHPARGAPRARPQARVAVPPVCAKLPVPALDGEPSFRPSTVSRAHSLLPVTSRNVG
ncbi:hypothetical protein QFZ64_005204 [Streptomyces sp. B3I8]|nr:hypothetical protein [Streptomyces sp. B3I8]